VETQESLKLPESDVILMKKLSQLEGSDVASSLPSWNKYCVLKKL
jgi:hypothetical protein